MPNIVGCDEEHHIEDVQAGYVRINDECPSRVSSYGDMTTERPRKKWIDEVKEDLEKMLVCLTEEESKNLMQ